MQFLIYILSYLIGTFPSGLLAARINGVDLQKSGSGNIGATNVARTIGKKAGIIVLLADILKGVLVCLIAMLILPEVLAIAGLLAVLGHCFSIPKLFKGGKGVATSLGVILFISPLTALISVIVFALIFYISQIVSLASISACFFAGVISWLLAPDYAPALSLIAAIVIIKHSPNIKKLIRGEENKFSFKK